MEALKQNRYMKKYLNKQQQQKQPTVAPVPAQ
jgi:hypothetical protein